MPRARELLIVADDLSGALDTGAVFAARGFSTASFRIARAGGRPPSASAGRPAATCWSWTPPRGTRAEDLPAARVRELVDEARRRGTRQFYKKIDSTLRGNLGDELAAFVRAVVVDRPALRRRPFLAWAGRHAGDSQLVDGVPLGSTAFAHDALNPVRTGSIARLLAEQAGLSTTHVPRPDAGRRRRDSEEDSRPAAATASRHVLVFDADDDSDLLRIARRLRSKGRLAVTAGSGGFAAALARTLALTRATPLGTLPLPAPVSGPLLVVVGSRHAAARRQCREALSGGFEAVDVPVSILRAPAPSGARWRTIVDRAADLVAKGSDVVLSVSDLHGPKRARAGEALGIARRLGRLVAAILTRHPVGALLASGGDTLAAATVACGWSRLRVHTEIAPGVARAATGDARAPWVVSKAGGFGQDTVWIDLRAALRGRP